MRKITTAILAFIFCLSQYQIMARCIPENNYSGTNSHYNLNSLVPTKLDFKPSGETTTITTAFLDCTTPVINYDVYSKNICEGSNISFEIIATGCDMNYQWLFNGNPILGANSNSFVISNATGANSGSYRCEITSPYGNITSNTAVLNVLTTMNLSYQNVSPNYNYGVEITPLNLTVSGGSVSTIDMNISDLASGTENSDDIARGQDGSIYLVGNAFNGIKKWNPNGTLTTLYTELGSFNRIAVDSQNNIYVAIRYGISNAIKKITPNGTVTNFGPGNLYARGIAVDKNGAVYVSDNVNSGIVKIALDGTVTTHINLLNSVDEFIVNEDGTVYINDYINNSIFLVTPGGQYNTIANNLPNVIDLSTDDMGNLYFVEQNIGSVKKIDKYGVMTTIATIANPNGIVSDGFRILYVTSTSGNLVKKIIQNVGYTATPSLPSGMTLNSLTGTISGTPQDPRSNTNYTISINNGCSTFSTGISFSNCGPTIIDAHPLGQTICSGNTLTLNFTARTCNPSYQWYKNNNPIVGANSNQLVINPVVVSDSGDYNCIVIGGQDELLSNIATVVVNRTPEINYPGLNNGYYLNEPIMPLLPNNTGGENLRNQYIANAYSTIPGAYVFDFAQDAIGNFYISENNSLSIKKIDTNGNITQISSTDIYANNIAVDSEGNVFATDVLSQSVKKFDTSGNISTLISNLNYSSGISIDTAGYIYLIEFINFNIGSTIKKISPNGSVINTWTFSNYLYYIAVSPSGIIYYINNGHIEKIQDNIISVFSNYNGYGRLSVGSDETVYVSNSYAPYIQKIHPNGTIIEDLEFDYPGVVKVAGTDSNTFYACVNDVLNYQSSTIQKIIRQLYTITPELPAGMQFDVQTGIISGTPTVLTPTTTYTIKTRNNCGDNYAHITFAVCTSTVIDLQPLPQTVCAGTSVSFEVIGSGSDVTYQWLKDNVAIAGATNPVFTIQYPTDNDVASYSCFVSGNCGSLTSEAVNLAVINNNSSAITTQPINANLCSPAGSTTSFTVATNMPEATYTWQYRIISTTNVNPGWNNLNDSINGVFSGITSPTLTITKASNYPINGTQFRVIINGTCGSVISDIATVYIVGATAAGRITAPTSVCLNNNIDFILLGESGTSIQWQSAPNATGTFTDIPGAIDQVYTLENAQTNSHLAYRAVVSNSCDNTSATTAIKTIKVDLPSLGGTVTGGGYLCSSGSSTLKLTGYRGKIQWEYSTDGINFSNAPRVTNLQTEPFSTTSTVSTSTTYLVSNLTTNVYFRAKVTNGACSTEYSNVVNYTPVSSAQAGYITPTSNTICSGTATTLTLNDPIGSILWEKSTDLINWSNTTKTGAIYTTPNLTVRTAFRAKVSVSGCSSVYSDVVFVNLLPKSLAKAIAVNTTLPSGKTALTAMCTNDASKVLTIGNGYIGAIQWQRSATSNTLGYTNIEGANGQSYTVTNPLVGANYFRAKFTNSCGVSVYSAAVIVYYTDCIQARAVVSNKEMSFDALAYPNPYSDTFRLKLSTSSESEVTLAVYDMTGKLLERSVKRPEDIQQENLGLNYASGVYNIVVTQDAETKTVRIVKR